MNIDTRVINPPASSKSSVQYSSSRALSAPRVSAILTVTNHNKHNNAQNPLHMFPHNFPIAGEVANLLATSHCDGIWETTRHNRHNGLLPTPTCYGLDVYVADLLQTCYGETGAMDFGLISANHQHHCGLVEFH